MEVAAEQANALAVMEGATGLDMNVLVE